MRLSSAGRYWIFPAALALILPYFATLSAPFDFVDDGCLVYAGPRHGVLDWLRTTWTNTTLEFETRGPFRPVAWAHWNGAAMLCGENALAQRGLRLAWAFLSAYLLLWLLSELGIAPWPALLTGLIAFWSPYPSEIWLGLGYSEAFAMLYALLALVAALRARLSARPWAWDLLGWTCALAAIATKNTFVAIVPAQMWLRLVGLDMNLRQGWQRHGNRVLLLSTSALYFIIHFICYKLDDRPKDYAVAGFSAGHVVRLGRGLLQAIGIDFMAAGLGLLAAAWWWTRSSARATDDNAPAYSILSTEREFPASVSDEHRQRLNVLGAGCLLACFGLGVYLPIAGYAGRYTIPAVFGAHLGLALMLSIVLASPVTLGKRVGQAALGLGLVGLLVTNLGRLDKLTARWQMLWQATRHLEAEADAGQTVAWLCRPLPQGQELSLAEGAHFAWHVQHRDRKTLLIRSEDVSSGAAHGSLDWALSGGEVPPAGSWQLVRAFHRPYWFGAKSWSCAVWKRKESPELY